MAEHHSFFRSSTSFTVCMPFYSADGSGLLILPLVDGFTTVCVQSYSVDGSALRIFLLGNSFHDGLRTVFLSGSWRIARSSACQWLSRRFICRIGPRMAADCSFFRSSTPFTTVCAQSHSVDGSAFPILPLVNSFHDSLCNVLLSGWRRIARSSPCQWLSLWFTRHIAQRMAADCSFFHSSTALTVCAPFSSTGGRGFLILLLVTGFPDCLRAVLLSGYPRNAHSSTGQWHSQFACHFAQWMAAYCSFFRSSTAFTTVFAPFSSADGSASLVLPVLNLFHVLRAVLRSRCQRIAHSSASRRLSRRFGRRFTLRMAAHRSFFRSSTSFTVCAPFYSSDGSTSLFLPVVNVFPSLRAVLLRGWQHLALSSGRQRLSRFARRFTNRMVADCSHLHASTAFTTVCAPFSSLDGSASLYLPVVNVFHGLRTIFLLGWQRIALSSGRQRLSRFACRFTPRMAADRSFLRLSMAS